MLLVAASLLVFNAHIAYPSTSWADIYSPRYNITEPVCVQFKYMTTAGLLELSLYTLNSNSIWTYQPVLYMLPWMVDEDYWYSAAYSITDGVQQIDINAYKFFKFPGVVDNLFIDDINITAGMCVQNITTSVKLGLHFT